VKQLIAGSDGDAVSKSRSEDRGSVGLVFACIPELILVVDLGLQMKAKIEIDTASD